jgi:hypothetical protein
LLRAAARELLIAARLLRGARHPVRSGQAIRQLLEARPGFPLGRTAAARRLLRRALQGRGHVLVVGPVTAVRQALPDARLDVVGTNSQDLSITVVSRALNEGSLPPRWDCVVVTDVDVQPERLTAAAGATLPGGLVTVLTSAGAPPVPPPWAEFQVVARSRSLQLLQLLPRR